MAGTAFGNCSLVDDCRMTWSISLYSIQDLSGCRLDPAGHWPNSFEKDASRPERGRHAIPLHTDDGWPSGGPLNLHPTNQWESQISQLRLRIGEQVEGRGEVLEIGSLWQIGVVDHESRVRVGF